MSGGTATPSRPFPAPSVASNAGRSSDPPCRARASVARPVAVGFVSMKIDRETLTDLPPSSKLVYLVLREVGPSTQAELADRTALPPRTVRYALDRLADVDVVHRRPCLRDARQSIYGLDES